MKICIPTNDKISVSDVFGRCKFLAIINQETNTVEYIDNSNNMLSHGAGLQTASLVLKNNADVLITYDLGPKANDVFKESSLTIYKITQIDTIDNLLKLLKEEKLNKIFPIITKS